MIISGIWHGSTLNYFIWGLCWGLVSVIYKAISDNFRDKRQNKETCLASALKSGIMFILASLL